MRFRAAFQNPRLMVRIAPFELRDCVIRPIALDFFGRKLQRQLVVLLAPELLFLVPRIHECVTKKTVRASGPSLAPDMIRAIDAWRVREEDRPRLYGGWLPTLLKRRTK